MVIKKVSTGIYKDTIYIQDVGWKAVAIGFNGCQEVDAAVGKALIKDYPKDFVDTGAGSIAFQQIPPIEEKQPVQDDSQLIDVGGQLIDVDHLDIDLPKGEEINDCSHLKSLVPEKEEDPIEKDAEQAKAKKGYYKKKDTKKKRK